ncbi:hypothetical protein FFLO_00380 [Filobasidium floriforme]|uniref:RlpA-like protein double-psi beta-barrel domain-containing protein n=1 Tax=Filobasidium floriforme TaxID=5210 RepID=A0A8K0NTN2_9TREE|nr:riboflavin aldehyde-forming enzyme [Filobasidium floriforme]KAG7575390.1 hypothetical protein FFLO_00380 [Filobasidium floriforme]KAH8089518.1 riboflavin aldehyde-forming enzyme [Filobasidium floriforme]
MFGFTKVTIISVLASLAMVNAAPVAEAEQAHVLESRLQRTGRSTWFNVGLGNCGWNSVDSDMVVAIGKGLYDRNNGNNCGQGVRIKANGKSVYAVVVDSCPSCGDSDLDMSPAVFQALANGGLGDGVMEAKWNFLKKN